MKKILFCTLLFVPFMSFGQLKAKTATFDIEWPDGSKSEILFTDSVKYFSIKSDNSIEFNGKKESDKVYLNPSLVKQSCKNDTTTFFPAATELFLGRDGQDACYQLAYSGSSQILFRNAKNPLLKGKLTYNVIQYEYCTLFVNNFCVGGYSGQEFIDFISYELNSDNTIKYITEQTVTGIEATNTSTTLTISPNPFMSTIQIESSQYANFQLTTVTGKVLKTNLSTNQPLDLSDLESGIYIAQFGNGVLYKRIVKQ